MIDEMENYYYVAGKFINVGEWAQLELYLS